MKNSLNSVSTCLKVVDTRRFADNSVLDGLGASWTVFGMDRHPVCFP
jgi:hypothetical protein